MESDAEADSSADTFLKFWNGDWSRPVVVHVCCGCCQDANDARDHMFSAAVGVDLLQSRDCDLPSLDDWGSCGGAAARSSLGILCHNILQQVYAAGLPDWNAMLPGAPDDDEDTDRKRLKIQKKVRSFLVCSMPQFALCLQSS